MSVDLNQWLPLPVAAVKLTTHLGAGWQESRLRKRIKEGELRQGYEWITTGSTIVVNPDAVLAYLIEQNKEAAN